MATQKICEFDNELLGKVKVKKEIIYKRNEIRQT